MSGKRRMGRRIVAGPQRCLGTKDYDTSTISRHNDVIRSLRQPYRYRGESTQRKAVPLRHCFTYVHAGSFLGTKHGPEGGRGDDKAMGNAQHTSNTINAVVRASIEMSSLLLRPNDGNSVTYSTTLTNIILYAITYISIEEHFIED